MDQHTTTIRFIDSEVGEAGRAAQSLRDAILDETPELEIRIDKDDPTTMDFGTTLVAILGSGSAIALVARGIAVWLSKHGQTIVVERDGDKWSFRGTGPIDENVARIVEALRR